MPSSAKINIFNIPANYHFFESLFDFLSRNFSGNISDVTILLPNQRSCRELRQIFLQKSAKNTAIILPKIKAISDISFEDFYDFLPNQDVEETIEQLLKIRQISGIEHLIFLAREIKNQTLFGENLDAAQLLMIATHLKNVFDEIEREEIDEKRLTQIDDSNLSKHRQITVEFLQEFHVSLKNSLIKNNIFFASSWQNFIINKFAKTLDKNGSKFPIIIAGSTGSVLAGKNLIKAISAQQNGYVILHGLSEAKESFNAENHPQFFLNNLLDFLEVKKTDITKIAEEKFLLSSQSRTVLLENLMLPAGKIDQWQKISATNENEISIVEAKNEIEEAGIIALMLAENFAAGKKSAFITNDDKLAKLVKYRLQDFSLPYNDSRNVGIFGANLVNFILLILDLIENDFSSTTLLAVWQNSLCKINHKEKTIEDFENKILRQDRKTSGFVGIKDKVAIINDQKLREFFDDFCDKISPLFYLKNSIQISEYIGVIIEVVSKLSQKTFGEVLALEEAEEELFQFFNRLQQNVDLVINPKNSSTLFSLLFSQISFFEKSNAMSPIQILSTIEARLLNFDLVIVASLNEGVFPQVENENWLGKKVRKDLGIERSLKKIGQNAYDFCNYLANPKIVLTRSLTNNGTLSSPSPFLLKLQTLGKKLQISFGDSYKYQSLLKSFDQAESLKISRPQPKPQKEFRPKKLAITDISKLISDPYSIYAKRILRLRELPKIDFEPGYAEFGSFVHKALEEFVKHPQDLEKSLINSRQIFSQYFLSEESHLIWWPKFENIFANFFDREQEIKAARNLTEVEVKLLIKNVLLQGKIDRVIFDEENLATVFDYKTGQVPSSKNVISGKEPQLTIAALMLIENGLVQEISELNYWKLSFSSEDKITAITKKSEEVKIMVAAAKAGLSSLLQYFSDEQNSYLAAPDLDNYTENEYSHLARIKEWQ